MSTAPGPDHICKGHVCVNQETGDASKPPRRSAPRPDDAALVAELHVSECPHVFVPNTLCDVCLLRNRAADALKRAMKNNGLVTPEWPTEIHGHLSIKIEDANPATGKPYLVLTADDGTTLAITTNLAEMIGGAGAGTRKRYEERLHGG